MSRRTQFFLAGAGALAAAMIATGVYAQSVVSVDGHDVSFDVAEVQSQAAAAREAAIDAAASAREQAADARARAADARAHAHEARARAMEAMRENGVRVEHDGDVTIIRMGGRDRAEHLRNILQLRPNQEAALTAYLEAMKPKEPAARMQRGANPGPMTTEQRLQRMEQRLAERQAAQRARIDATRRFYNQLDAGQKKAFDELPLMMGPMDREVRMIRAMHHPMPPIPPAPPMPPVPPAPPAPPSI
jgi:hypothetical protein